MPPELTLPELVAKEIWPHESDWVGHPVPGQTGGYLHHLGRYRLYVLIADATLCLTFVDLVAQDFALRWEGEGPEPGEDTWLANFDLADRESLEQARAWVAGLLRQQSEWA